LRPVTGSRRVAVTGLGVVCALGNSVDAFWQGCLELRTVVEAIPEAWSRYSPLRSAVWSPLGAWERETPMLAPVERRRLDASSQMAILAAEEAVIGAGLEPHLVDRRRNAFALRGHPSEGMGVFMGTGVGGVSSLLANAAHVFLHRSRERLHELSRSLAEPRPQEARAVGSVLSDLTAPQALNPFVVTMTMPNAVSANLAIKLGLRGPCPTFCCACASGTVALGRAFRAIRDGECSLILAGGAEHLSDHYGCCFRGFDAAGALAQGDLPPEEINRPFDRRRSGFLFSQGGAAVLVLEELESARARGAPLLAEIRGYGETSDAHGVLAMEPSGEQMRRALVTCLAEAGLEPREVGYVNAHGTGTQANDPLEARILGEVIGSRVAVSATKSLLGHTLGASGALEAVATVRTLRDGVAHGCRNLEEPVAELGFLTEATPVEARHALSQSFAFGGQNAVVAFSRL
jgi:3-oxoacyl-[acyl-carrier-protein] synthase II